MVRSIRHFAAHAEVFYVDKASAGSSDAGPGTEEVPYRIDGSVGHGIGFRDVTNSIVENNDILRNEFGISMLQIYGVTGGQYHPRQSYP